MAGTVYVDKILTDTGTTVNVSGVHFSKTGNVTFTGTSSRIFGDFSNLTLADRVLFQTTTTNTGTSIAAIPNGTPGTSQTNFATFNNANPANSSVAIFGITDTGVQIASIGLGTGNALPIGITVGSEAMRIDTSGNVGIGTSSPAQRLSVIGNIALGTDSTNQSARIQVADASAQATDARFLFRNGTDTQAALRIVLNSANFLTIDAVQANNSATTKDLVFQPNGGNVGIGTSSPSSKLEVSNGTITSAFNPNSVLGGFVAGTTTNHPLIFASNNTERARIDASGYTQFSSNLVMPYQGAPTSKSGAATLSGAELVTGILNTTGTTYTITLPTGTNIEGALTWSANNVSLDWYVINTASGTITIGANGNTTLGSLTIATGTSAHFRIRRTAANTFTVYRL